MAATEYWVSAAVGADTGAGTSFGDPMGAADGDPVQRLLDTITANETDGDIIYVIDDGTYTPQAELSFATYGSPSTGWALTLKGLHADGSTASDLATDVGIGAFDLGAFSGYYISNKRVNLQHLSFANGTDLIYVDDAYVKDCSFSDASNFALRLGAFCVARNCYAFNCGVRGFYATATSCRILDSHVMSRTADSNGATIACIDNNNSGGLVQGCTVSTEGSSDGIRIGGATSCLNNSILSSSGTGEGIQISGNNYASEFANNIIEGFSGTGGIGITCGGGASRAGLIGNNKIYNCTTPVVAATVPGVVTLPDTTLTKSGFLKQGADTFANRENFFAPRDHGGIIRGAF